LQQPSTFVQDFNKGPQQIFQNTFEHRTIQRGDCALMMECHTSHPPHTLWSAIGKSNGFILSQFRVAFHCNTFTNGSIG